MITTTTFFLMGIVQLSILTASALVPMKLNWKQDLQPLPRLVQQLFWVYGGYVVLGIVSLGIISMVAAEELAEQGLLSRCFCAYGFAFWGVRICLQAFLDVKPHLTNIWYKIGYHCLTVAFGLLTAGFAVGAFL